jgi:hypothetical protein
LARLSLLLEGMNAKHRHVNTSISAKSVRKSVRKVAKRAAKGTSTALAVVAHQLHDVPRLAKQAGGTARKLSIRTKRLVKSNPARVLLGAAAVGFIIAKVSRLVS